MLVYSNNYYKVEFLRVSQLNQCLYINYEKNRPADEKRIEDMMINLKNEERIPNEICVWKKSFDENYYIYDGLHRLKCAFRLFNNIPNKNMLLTIKTFYTDDENLIKKDFENINKAVSLPLMYIEENNQRKKDIIENVVMYLCKNYPRFTSSSRNFKKPNFNRDVIINLFYQIDNLNVLLQNETSNEKIENKFIKILQDLNFSAKKQFENEPKTISKCHFHQFYLFNYDTYKIQTKINNKLLK